MHACKAMVHAVADPCRKINLNFLLYDFKIFQRAFVVQVAKCASSLRTSPLGNWLSKQ